MEYERFLERIKQLRIERGISLKRIGAELGVSYAQYANIETGKSGLKVEDLISICKVLKVCPKHLFDEDIMKIGEYSAIVEGLKKLPDREFHIIKDLVMLMSLSTDDL